MITVIISDPEEPQGKRRAINEWLAKLVNHLNENNPHGNYTALQNHTGSINQSYLVGNYESWSDYEKSQQWWADDPGIRELIAERDELGLTGNKGLTRQILTSIA